MCECVLVLFFCRWREGDEGSFKYRCFVGDTAGEDRGVVRGLSPFLGDPVLIVLLDEGRGEEGEEGEDPWEIGLVEEGDAASLGCLGGVGCLGVGCEV